MSTIAQTDCIVDSSRKAVLHTYKIHTYILTRSHSDWGGEVVTFSVSLVPNCLAHCRNSKKVLCLHKNLFWYISQNIDKNFKIEKFKNLKHNLCEEKYLPKGSRKCIASEKKIYLKIISYSLAPSRCHIGYPNFPISQV